MSSKTMDAKYNIETENRPHGNRYIDGDILKIDLPAYIAQLKSEEAWKSRDRNAVTVFKSENVTVTVIILAENAEVIPGSYDGTGIMSLQVMNGFLLFVNGSNDIELTAGQMLTVHEHIPFKAVARTETVCLLTMIK